jgi:hypothetical protein
MKKIFIIPVLSIAVAMCLVSCLGGDGRNMSEGTLPAVVGYSTTERTPTMITASGEFAAPELATGTSIPNTGDCILARFTLDWDNQPANATLYHATNIIYINIDQTYAQIDGDFDETTLPDGISEDNLLPIVSITPQSYNPILNGKVFFSFAHNVSVKQEMDYTAIVKPGSTSDETATLYITGRKLNSPNETTYNVENLYAIDMLHVIRELGTESTTQEAGIDTPVQQLKIKIKCCTGVDAEGAPKYQEYTYNYGTITLAVYK